MFTLKRFNPFLTNNHALRINASIVNHKRKCYAVYRSQHLFAYNSHSYLVEFNDELEIVSARYLQPENGNTAFEDIRLFSVNDLLFAFYTYLPFVDDRWRWEYGVGFGIIDLDQGILKHQVSLRHLSLQPQNKNWVPYYYRGELFVITDFSPRIRIIKISDRGGKLVMQEEYIAKYETVKWDYGEIRGGTPLVPQPRSKKKWLYGFVHSHLKNFNGFIRYYFYTIIRLDPKTKELQYYSYPVGESNDDIQDELIDLWKQSTHGEIKVIFPMGIISNNDGLLVSFGVDDIRSKLKLFKWDYIESLFPS